MADELRPYMESMVKLMGTLKRPRFNLKYACIEDFVLKNGRPFTEIVRTGFGRRGRRKQCFMNAFHLAVNRTDLIYCEGYAYAALVAFPTIHGWCVDEQGRVYDPTWKDGVEYFGVPFSMKYVIKTIFARGSYGVLDNFEMRYPLLRGDDGFQDKRMK